MIRRAAAIGVRRRGGAGCPAGRGPVDRGAAGAGRRCARRGARARQRGGRGGGAGAPGLDWPPRSPPCWWPTAFGSSVSPARRERPPPRISSRQSSDRWGRCFAPPGLLNNELGLALDRAPGHPGHRLPGAGDVRPASGQHRRAGPDRPAVDRGGAQRRHRAPGRAGSREVIATTKAELVQAVPAEGVAVLNADDPVVAAMAARTAARVVTVGRSDDP